MGSSAGESIDWDDIYVHLIACTGWTWDYIDQHMTLPRLIAMNSYWTEHPPLHLLVSAYFGVKSGSDNSAFCQKETNNTEHDLQEFANLFMEAGGISA